MQRPIPHRAAVILCGGQSRRMGVAKASLPFGEETLLARAVRIIAPTVSEIVVVAAPGQILPPFPVAVRVIQDENPGLGPLEGIRCGLVACSPDIDRILVCGCDTPLVTAAAIQILFEKLTESCDAAVAADIQRMHPTFGVYRVSAVGVAAEQLALGELSLHSFVKRLAVTAIPIHELGAEDLLHNVNTPEEYAYALASAGLPPVEIPPAPSP